MGGNLKKDYKKDELLKKRSSQLMIVIQLRCNLHLIVYLLVSFIYYNECISSHYSVQFICTHICQCVLIVFYCFEAPMKEWPVKWVPLEIKSLLLLYFFIYLFLTLPTVCKWQSKENISKMLVYFYNYCPEPTIIIKYFQINVTSKVYTC